MPLTATASIALPSQSSALRTDFWESMMYPGRLVEVGFIANFEPREFAIYFVSFPLWLLALERIFCSKLHILGWASAGDLRRQLK
jgi:hypothetical protein